MNNFHECGYSEYLYTLWKIIPHKLCSNFILHFVCIFSGNLGLKSRSSQFSCIIHQLFWYRDKGYVLTGKRWDQRKQFVGLQSFGLTIREVMYGHRWLILLTCENRCRKFQHWKQGYIGTGWNLPVNAYQRFVGVRCRCKFGTESGFTRTRKDTMLSDSVSVTKIYWNRYRQ